MSNIDWQEAPEGTTHADCNGNWYKFAMEDTNINGYIWEGDYDFWEDITLDVQEIFELIPESDYLWYDKGTVMMYPCKGEQFLWKNQVATTLAVTSEGDLVFEVDGKVHTMDTLSKEYIQPLPSPTQLAAQAKKEENRKLFNKITENVIHGKRGRGLTSEQVFEELYAQGFRICVED